MKSAKLAAVIFCLVFLGFFSATAQVTIDPLGPPHDMENISKLSTTAQIVNLTDNGDPLTPTALEKDSGDWNFTFTYNKTGGTERAMEHLGNSYYYADFNFDASKGSTTFFELEDQSVGGEAYNATESYTPGNITFQSRNDLSGKIDPEEDIDVEVEAYDFAGNFEDQADVDFYITNVSWSSSVKDTLLDSGGGDPYYKNLGNSFDLDYSSTYVFHIEATNKSLPYNNSFGSASLPFETLQRLDGKLESLDSIGCRNRTGTLSCERGADVEASVNITASSAENVTMDLELYNKSSGKWENHSEHTFESDGGLFVGNFTVPDINTSSHEDLFRLNFELSSQDTTASFQEVIQYADFEIKDQSSSNTNPPKYQVEIEAIKPFTKKPLEPDRLNGYVNISEIIDPDTPTFEPFTVFNLSDMKYDEDAGYYTKKVDFDFDEHGEYAREIHVENLYGVKYATSGIFNINEVERTLELGQDELSLSLQREKVYETEINITDLGAGSIIAEADGDIENITTVNNGSAIDMSQDETEDVNISFNVTDVEDYTGEIKFTDNASDYNETVDVELNSPTCAFRNGSLCASGNLDVTAEEEGEEIFETLTLDYIGPADHEETLTPTFDGNISDFVGVTPDLVEINEENSSFEFNVSFTADSPDYTNGTLEIDGLDVPISMESEFEISELGFNLSKGEVDLGTVPEGSERSFKIEVENTGTVDLTSFDASSTFLDPSISFETVEAGNTENVTVIIPEIDGSGSIEIEGSNDNKSDTASVEVSVETITDLAEEKSALDDRVSELDPKVNSTILQRRLDEASTKISEMETMYNQEKYEEANELYQEITSTLDEIESETSASETTDPTGSTDPETGPDTGGESNEDSGLGMLPLIAGLLVLLLIGFVAFTSVIPERGDPLYNVLGK